MEAALSKKLNGKQPTDILNLNLDTAKFQRIAGLESFTRLQSLSMNGTGLLSLENIPHLPKLRKLLLADNNIGGGLEALFKANLHSLEHLDLSNNRIDTLETLQPLQNLSSLRHLDLLECKISKLQGFRDKIFRLLPSLVTLNGMDRDGKEVDEEDDDDEAENDEQVEQSSGQQGDGEEDEEEEEEQDEEEGEEDDEEAVDAVLGSSSREPPSELLEQEDDEDDGDEMGSEQEDASLDILTKDNLGEDEDDGEYEPFLHRHSDQQRAVEDAVLDDQLQQYDEDDEQEEQGQAFDQGKRKRDSNEFNNKQARTRTSDENDSTDALLELSNLDGR